MSGGTKYDFREIQFGYTDAQTEGQECPNLMTEGYVDIEDVVSKALFSTIFLFLGYKGSGKSALSEHLRLSAGENYIIDQQGLKDFPFRNFSKLNSSDENPILRTKQIWNWLLAVKVLSNLIKDPDAVSTRQYEVDKLFGILSQNGLAPINKISDLVSKTTSKKVKASMKVLSMEYESNESENSVEFNQMTKMVEDLIYSYKESKRHIIVIDDLDDILAPNGNQFYTIAGLINVAKEMNTKFINHDIQVKFLVLCRTDMFEKLSDPNRNKIMQNCSFSFSWYDEGVNKPYESRLIQMIDLRGKLRYPELKSVVETFFPKFFKGKSIYNALLDMTRHTPRDFIQLMNCIKGQCVAPKVRPEDIETGFKKYSADYFLHEIQDEMTGYVSPENIETIIGAMSSLHKREFTYDELLGSIENRYPSLASNLEDILNVMYNCSAIGHTYYFREDNSTRVTFKYRNRISKFSIRDKIIIHNGLWQSLNVNY